MELHIRPLMADDIEEVVQLSLLAWQPVFQSFENVLGSHIYTRLYPDWRSGQRRMVEQICQAQEHTQVWVAETEGKVAGFIAYTLNSKENRQEDTGEVELLAVHPDCQRQGIATALNQFALDKMKESGIRVAVVATGGDPGHAPARKSYEKVGYTALPLVRYYKAL